MTVAQQVYEAQAYLARIHGQRPEPWALVALRYRKAVDIVRAKSDIDVADFYSRLFAGEDWRWLSEERRESTEFFLRTVRRMLGVGS